MSNIVKRFFWTAIGCIKIEAHVGMSAMRLKICQDFAGNRALFLGVFGIYYDGGSDMHMSLPLVVMLTQHC